MPVNNETILIAILAVTALAVFLQAIILLALYATVRKSARSLENVTHDFHDSVMPVLAVSREVLEHSREVLQNIAPNLESGARNFAEIAGIARSQTDSVQSSVAEVVDRFRNQAARLDTQLSTALDSIDQAAVFVQQTVTGPLRQVTSLISGVRAAVDSLRGNR